MSTVFSKLLTSYLPSSSADRKKYIAIVASILGISYIVKTFWRAFVVPRSLRHIPKVSTIDWFLSVIKGESYDTRIKRLVLPMMNEHGLCLKYIMGRWLVAVGDPVLLQQILKDVETYPKEQVSMSPVSVIFNLAVKVLMQSITLLGSYLDKSGAEYGKRRIQRLA